jgi:hypothetical protein
MTHHRLAVIAATACCAATLCAAGPFDQLKGKVKEGMYEYKMDMDMGQVPGMPPGMGKQTMTVQHCVTPEDIEKGRMGRGGGPRGEGGLPENCEVKNMNVSGNAASYTMDCKPPREMHVDNKIMFTSDGYKMDMKMSMNQGGRMMNMTQHMEARYLGPCK